MKNLIYITILCLISNIGLSQEFKTEHSKYFTKESEKDKYRIYLASPYGFTTLHHLDNVMMDNTKTMVLTKYDQSMQAIETIDFNLPKLGNRASDLHEIIELDNQLIFLSKVMQKKEGKHQVNAQIFSQENNSVSTPKVLASFPFEKYSKSGYYQTAVSPDQSKIAVLANMPYEKKTQEVVKIYVYDNQLNLLWEQKETLPYDSEKAYQEQIFVQNSGTVIMNKTTDAFKKTRKSELISFNGKSKEIKTFSEEGFIPMEMALINVNGKSMLTGFFWDGMKAIIQANSKEGNDNSGAFLFDLNENKLVGLHQWSNGLANANDLKSLEVIDVKVIDDNIYLIGEKQITTSEFRKSGNTPTTELDYFYTFGSSVIVNFDTKGTLKSFTPLFDAVQLKNYAKEKGSLSVLYLENGLRVLSNANSNQLSFNSYFTSNEASFSYPRVIPFDGGTSTIPSILPSTVKRVENYGIVYYVTNYNDRYWLNKMTW